MLMSLLSAVEDKSSGLVLSSFRNNQSKFSRDFTMAVSKPQRHLGVKVSATIVCTDINALLSISEDYFVIKNFPLLCPHKMVGGTRWKKSNSVVPKKTRGKFWLWH